MRTDPRMERRDYREAVKRLANNGCPGRGCTRKPRPGHKTCGSKQCAQDAIEQTLGVTKR